MGNSNRTLPKWLAYTGAFFLCFFLERCVCNRWSLWGGTPLLAPLTAAAVGFFEGAFAGSLFGLGTGLLSALAIGRGSARLIWCYTAIGIACGATLNKSLGRTFPGYLLCALGSLAFLEGIQLFIRLLFLKEEAQPVLALAGAEGMYSLLFAPVIYLAFWAVYRRFRSELEF